MNDSKEFQDAESVHSGSWHLHVKKHRWHHDTPRRASTDVLKEVFYNHFFGVVWSVSVAVFAALVAALQKLSQAVLIFSRDSIRFTFEGSSGEPRAVGLNEAWEYQSVYWKTSLSVAQLRH